tara:strand:+ start:1410 stop:1745 length:336 start_codon:yes stop_codon:yes gene_type:complete
MKKVKLAELPDYDGLEDYKDNLEEAIDQSNELLSALNMDVDIFTTKIYALAEKLKEWEKDQDFMKRLKVGENLLNDIVDFAKAVEQVKVDLEDNIDDMDAIHEELSDISRY